MGRKQSNDWRHILNSHGGACPVANTNTQLRLSQSLISSTASPLAATAGRFLLAYTVYRENSDEIGRFE